VLSADYAALIRPTTAAPRIESQAHDHRSTGDFKATSAGATVTLSRNCQIFAMCPSKL
jgi:hypothetical protein